MAKKRKDPGAPEGAPEVSVVRKTHTPLTRKRKIGPAQRWTENQLQVYIKEAEEPYQFLPALQKLCEDHALKLFVKSKLRRDAAAGIRTEVIRIAIIATGCLEKGLLQEEDINRCTNMDQLILKLQQALGFHTYNLALSKDAGKRAMLRLSRQDRQWEIINEFRLAVTIPQGESPFERYLDAYKAEARLVKMRVLLGETIERNIPFSQRHKFISRPKKDPNGDEVLMVRNVFSYLLLGAYFGFEGNKKKLSDFIEFKNHLSTHFDEVCLKVETLVVNFIKPEEAAKSIFKLPEFQGFLDRVKILAATPSLHAFISYFNADDDAAYLSKEVKRIVDYVGEWKWRRSKAGQTDNSEQIVSHSLAICTNREFLLFLHTYPWFAKFLVNKEVVRYLFLVKETDERYKKVINYIKPETLNNAFAFLNSDITVSNFLRIYTDGTFQNGEKYLELARLANSLTRKATMDPSKDRLKKRAVHYIGKMLHQWSDHYLIEAFTSGEIPADICELLHHSFKIYLGYLRREQGARWVLPFEFDEDLLDFVQPADVAKVMLRKQERQFVAATKHEAAVNIVGKEPATSDDEEEELIDVQEVVPDDPSSGDGFDEENPDPEPFTVDT